ncbi:hypothetical protein NDN08_005366 [Rhodosorus marinus]|uniref:RING finger and CHY zinc finger domain-containing protein 1 n=1 Tax=Rhodosorus marinus TaxID=101924 RepID=A0AAV8V1F2_9RHOD|nr:hypothetical protein NDN08_005366 [Rhodosorus marinus]
MSGYPLALLIERESFEGVENSSRCLEEFLLQKGLNDPYRCDEDDQTYGLGSQVSCEGSATDSEHASGSDLSTVQRTYNDESSRVLGCSHYKRGCRVVAFCCRKLYTCRRCHDENEDHVMDRKLTQEIQCMTCGLFQAPCAECKGCGSRFARHFCGICNLWEDEPGKDIYHCDDCGICRLGKGIGKDYFHCSRCNACVALESKADHKCVAGSLDCNCPVCHDPLFSSTERVIFMRCGHAMHDMCFNDYTKHYFTCPLCRKALGDMTEFYKAIDEQLKVSRVCTGRSDFKSQIFCNDCEVKSEVPHHSQYHKCHKCEGYNTMVLNVIRT